MSDERAKRGGDGLSDHLLAKLRPSIPGHDLLDAIGAPGGQAIVYRAIEHGSGRVVAVKVFHGGQVVDAGVRERYEREVRALQVIDHPNVVRYRGHGKSPTGYDYIVTEYVDGPHLGDYLAKLRDGRGPPGDPTALLQAFRKVCAGTQAAHLRGIAHRDLSPDNIRIDRDGEPKVVDFGMARTAFDRFFRTGPGDPSRMMFLGKPAYASPEQVTGGAVDVRSDVYTLGVILYEVLTNGRSPYPTDEGFHALASRIVSTVPTPPSQVMAEADGGRRRRPRPFVPSLVNDSIEQVVLKAMAKHPAGRYQSAGELEQDVALYLAGQPTRAMIECRQRRAASRRRQRAVLAASAVAVVGASIAGVKLASRPTVGAHLGRPRPPTPATTMPTNGGAIAVTVARAAATADDSGASAATAAADSTGVRPRSVRSPAPRSGPVIEHRFHAFSQAVGHLAFDPSGRWLRAAGASERGPAVTWELSTDQPRDRSDDVLPAVEFSPDGDWQFTPGQLLSLRTGVRHALGSEIAGNRGRFSADGSRFAGTGTVENQGVRVYRVSDGAKLLDKRQAFEAWLGGCSIDLSPDGRRIAVAGGDDRRSGRNGIEVWDVDSGQELPPPRWQGGSRILLKFSANGTRLFAAWVTRLTVFDVASGEPVGSFQLSIDTHARGPALFVPTAAGVRVGYWDHDRTFSVWDADAATRLAERTLSDKLTLPPVFSADGTRALTIDAHEVVIVWDAHQLTAIDRWISKLDGSITALAITADGAHGAAADDRGDVCVWRVR